MEASGPSSDKQTKPRQLIIDVLGTTIAVSTLVIPLFLIMSISSDPLDQPLRQSNSQIKTGELTTQNLNKFSAKV